MLENVRDGLIHCDGKLLTESSTPFFIPSAGIESLRLGLWSKDDARRHAPPSNF
jgi:hypothetical protein